MTQQNMTQLTGQDETTSFASLSEEQKQEMMFSFNDNQTDYPKCKTIVDLFVEQANTVPENIALNFEGKEMTYSELHRKSNQLANYLIEQYDIKPEDMVAIKMDRGEMMMVATLGVLKSGAAYVPIALDYPQARIDFILEDTNCKVCISDMEDTGLSIFADQIWKQDESLPKTDLRPDHLMYVIYTSGSTGKPKGVEVTHGNLVTLVKKSNFLEVKPTDKLLQICNFAFDGSVFEIFTCLCNGATLVLIKKAKIIDIQLLAEEIVEREVSVAVLTAALFNILAENEHFKQNKMRQLMWGGELMSVPATQKMYEILGPGKLVHIYGPTENSVFTTFYPVNHAVTELLPIGQVLSNNEVLILDKNLNLCGPNAPGEICIAGPGVSRGYFNRPELTAEKFIPHPFKEGKKLYRSGDLGAWTKDGNVEFLGRIDDQVKIRGFRIEPGEIEHALLQHEDLHQVVVVIKEISNQKSIVAYYVPRNKTQTPALLKEFLQKGLPHYMIPNYFIELDSLPRTPNDKIDKKALPLPELPSLEEKELPQTPTEKQLESILAGLLNIKHVALDDNFFELGCNSLIIAQFVSRVDKIYHRENLLTKTLSNPSIRKLAEVLDDSAGHEPKTQGGIQIRERPELIPLTFQMEQIWFLQNLVNKNMAYNAQCIIDFHGDLKVDIFERALSQVIKRHEIFRTTFPEVNGQITQLIHDPWEAKLDVIDLRHLPKEERRPRAQSIIKEVLAVPFDYNKMPQVVWRMFHMDHHQYLFLNKEFHFVHDGWSAALYLNEIKAWYKYFHDQEPVALPEKPFQMADYALWQRGSDYAIEIDKQIAFWKEELKGSQHILTLPLDYPRPETGLMDGGMVRKDLPSDLYMSLRKLGQKTGVTLFSTLITAFAKLLSLYSGQDDILIGSATANRKHKESEGVIGMLVNMIPLRMRLGGDPDLGTLLKRTQSTLLRSLENQGTPFQKLVKAINPTRMPGMNPLFQTMFSFHDSAVPDLNFSGLKGVLTEMHNNSAKADISIISIPRAEQRIGRDKNDDNQRLSTLWEYNTELYSRESMEIMYECYVGVLRQMVDNPDIHINQITSLKKSEVFTSLRLSDEERIKVLEDFNSTAFGDYKGTTFVDAFAEQVKKTPLNIALSCGNIHLTYKELDQRSNQLANYLRKQYDIQPDDLIGIMLNRSEYVIIGILGIMKSGAAYVPIDPAYPQNRIDHIVEDSGCKAVLMDSGKGLSVENQDIWQTSDAWLQTKPQSGHLAYIIYTSGSTGKSKGVAIEHSSLNNYARQFVHYFDLKESDRFIQGASISFDISIDEIFPILLSGGNLHISKKGFKFMDEFAEEITKNQITHVSTVPALVEFLNGCDYDLSTVKTIISGGDALVAHQMDRLLPKCDIYNTYGPTEATVCATYHKVVSHDLVQDRIPIGGPIANTQVYILNDDHDLVPLGVLGEICIAGDGLARGYLHSLELTLEKFIENPFKQGEMLYKTGDLGRWTKEGEIEFFGRKDYQVKIQGFRVELGEIEHQLSKGASIKDCVVLAKKINGLHKLIAFVVTKDAQKSKTEGLREHLTESLPEYMIPSYFVDLDSVPLDANGKANRKLLLAMDIELGDLSQEEDFEHPKSVEEKLLANIWSEVLRIDLVGINSNFFHLGGDSIKAIQTIAKLEGYSLKANDIFTSPTIKKLAKKLKKKEVELSQATVEGEVMLTPVQEHFFDVQKNSPEYYNQAMYLTKKGGFSPEILEKSLEVLCEHHDALRMVYKGKVQMNRKVEGKHFSMHTISCAFENIEEELLPLQAGMDLSNGPLLKAALFETEKGQRLCIIIHHLIVDGVSWRILQEDLQTAYGQIEAGESVKLPLKTSSFQTWAKQLNGYAESERLAKERAYWESLLPFAKNKNSICNIEDTFDTFIELDADTTEFLLRCAPAAYRTEINDLLLTALGVTMSKWKNEKYLLVELEGHGREELFESTELSRTVGWFTTTYPVLLDMNACTEGKIGLQIQTIKEALRKIPNKGIGFGVLKELAHVDIIQAIKPSVLLNYLGEFKESNEHGSWQNHGFAKNSISQKTEIEHAVSLNGAVRNGKLGFKVTAQKALYAQADIDLFGKYFGDSINELNVHCKGIHYPISSPADFKAMLSLEEWQTINQKIPNREIEDIYGLSPLQEGMLFHWLKDPSSYLVQLGMEVNGDLNLDLLEQALNLLVKEHEVYRTSFLYEGLSKPWQVVRKEQSIGIHFIDLRNSGSPQQDIEAYQTEDRRQGFNLETGQLLRLAVFQLQEGAFYLLKSEHHILTDGWSGSIFREELFTAYQSLIEGKEIKLEERPTFKEYVQWIEKQDKKAGLQFWKEYLSGCKDIAMLSQKSRKLHKSKIPSKETLEISNTQKEQLERIARQQQITLNALLHGLWASLMYRYSGKEDVVFGNVSSGRSADLEGITDIFGMLINTLPVRIQADKGMSVVELAKSVHQNAIESRKHEYLGLSDIQKAAQVSGDFFDCLFVFESYPKSKASGEKQALRIGKLQGFEETNYPLSIIVRPYEDSISFTWVYDGGLYEDFLIKQISKHFQRLLEQLLENQHISIDKMKLLTEQEEQGLIHGFNDNKTEYPRDKTVVDLFEEQVQANPEAVAVLFEGRELTYKELDSKANQLANYLIDNCDIKKEDLVAVMMDRSEWLIVSMLGVLKAGAAYVPIDPSYPQARIEFMLEDSQCKLCIAEHTSRGVLSISETAIWKENTLSPKTTIEAGQLAYIMYTSGSTGKPKGVMVMHRNIVRLVKNTDYLQFTNTDRFLFASNPAFDASTLEVWTPLLNGGGSVVAKKDTLLSGKKLKELIDQNKVNFAFFTVGLFNQFTEDRLEVFENLSVIMTGGDIVSAAHIAHVKAHLPDIQVVNGYGPTENTTLSSTYRIKGDEGDTIPIGKPIANSQIYIFDAVGELCPIGVEGEIYLGGDGLARGYLNRPKLTAEKFIPHPFKKGERLYRSGDLGRWLPDGNIDFVARVDKQVKIRGFRIELGEIEQFLSNQQGVKEAKVLVKEINREKEVVAYVVAEEKTVVADLKKSSENQLPAYMIPSYFVSLDQMPLTLNGKTDTKTLGEMPLENINSEEGYSAPQTHTETALASMWANILGRERISRADDFFALGGHSIQAMRLLNQVRKEFQVELVIQDIFQTPLLKHMASRIDATGCVQSSYIPQAEHQKHYPLSHAQKRLWILHQFEESRQSYNVRMAYTLKGDFELGAFEKSVRALVERHEVLRTNFVDIEGEPMQCVQPPAYVHFSIETGMTTADLLKREFAHAFDLANEPLLRVSILQTASDTVLCFVNIHHIVFDGWSADVFWKELAELYKAFLTNEAYHLPEMRVHYKDFAIWQKSLSQSPEVDRQKAYWLQKFSGELPVMQIPTDHQRPAIKTYNGQDFIMSLGKELSDRLHKFALSQDASLFMLLNALLHTLLHRYTGQTDICVGTVNAGRNHPDLEGQIGYYLKTLALRNKSDQSICFDQLLAQTKQTVLEAFAYQDYPFDRLLEDLDLERNTARSPLFDVLLVLQNNESSNFAAEGTEIKKLNLEHKVSRYDLSFAFTEDEKGLQLNLEYNTDLFTEKTAERMCQHFKELTEAVLTNPSECIGALNILPEAEKQYLLEEINDTHLEYDQSLSMLDLFANQVAKIPEQDAVVFEGKHFSYEWLNQKSNQLANYLTENKHIRKGDLVGVLLERSEWMLVAIFGILKTGAAYVPIDPQSPEGRICFILEDTDCKLLLTDQKEADGLSIYKSDIWQTSPQTPQNSIGLQSPAYIIYTSGSTGKPKGVAISHAALYAFLISFDKFTLQTPKRGLAVAPVIFDVSVYEFFSRLCFGTSLHILNEESRINPWAIANSIQQEKIDTAYISGTLLEEVLNALQKDGEGIVLKQLLVGAMSISQEILTKWKDNFPQLEIINAYGPTEITVCATTYHFTERTPWGINTPIGKPSPNYQVYLLDEHQKLVPFGMLGETCISGDSLASGYLNRPELTGEKFIPHPYKKGEKLYRTGDLARWLPDGNLEFAGRIDEQVKIRGYRIEPGEVEHALLQNEKVAEAVVMPLEVKESTELVAFYAPVVGCKTGADDLNKKASDFLPPYMIPTYWVELEKLPLTANGKIDRKKLAELPINTDARQSDYETPKTTTEIKLAGLWKEILQLESISRNDNFFQIGGQSIKAVQLVHKVQKEMKLRIKVSQVFRHARLEDLALLIDQEIGRDSLVRPIPKASEQERYPLSNAQRRLWVLHQFEGGNIGYNIASTYRVKGRLNIPVLQKALQALIERHEILRTAFGEEDGEPYQRIRQNPDLPLWVSEVQNEEALHKIMDDEIHYRFDFAGESLIRLRVIQMPQGQDYFIVSLHHIVADGWSMNLLVKELNELYGAVDKGRQVALPTLSIQYKDFALWQNALLIDEAMNKHRAYWHAQLSGEFTPLELPCDFKRPAIQTYEGAHLEFSIDKETSSLIYILCNEQDVSLFVMLNALLKVLLFRYSGQEDILIGTGSSGRVHNDLENQIGLYVNTLVLRDRIDGKQSFSVFLQQIKSTVLSAFEHEMYPFDRLVEDLELERDASRHPLFDVMMILQNNERSRYHFSDLEIERCEREYKISKMDLGFYFYEDAGAIKLLLEYSTSLFSERSMQSMFAHFENLLKEALRDVNQAVGQMNLLSEHERDLLVHKNIQVQTKKTGTQSIVDLFEGQARAKPNKTALVFKETSLSYAELETKANQLANYLLGKYQLQKDDMVGLMTERSEWTVIAILGILKTGAAYVPIDPASPQERMQFILQDTDCKTLLSDRELEGALYLFDECIWKVGISTAPNRTISPDSLAYVIYTSGSTGMPKGVMVEHSSAVNLANELNAIVCLGDEESCLMLSQYFFDASVETMIMAWLSGGKLVMISMDELMDPASLQNVMSKHAVTHTDATPSMIRYLPIDANSSLRRVVCGGEACPQELIDKMSKYCDFWNAYGPTEATVTTTVKKLQSGDRITIGKPIGQAEVYILNSEGSLCPPNISGEICIAGAGLARGYLNRPKLTSEKFVPHPFKKGERMYRSGDFGRMLPDGNIEFIGRADDQVKVRGHRIELGEIEAQIRQQPAVNKVVVLPSEEGDLKACFSYDLSLLPEATLDELSKVVKEDWDTTFKEAYQTKEGVDGHFDISGWKSSYTRNDIPSGEMQIWVEETVKSILAYRPRRVLEIGCGTGLLLFRVAPHVQTFHGIDISEDVVRQVQGVINGDERFAHVSLAQGEAYEPDKFGGEKYDMIIINSVVQYFPDAEYLKKTLLAATALLEENGRLFVGDVRNNDLLPLFLHSIQCHQATGKESLEKISENVRMALDKEEELAVSPAFFKDFVNKNQLGLQIEMQLKRGAYVNELSKFRYDVCLFRQDGQSMPTKWLDWKNESMQSIEICLEKRTGEPLAIKCIPDARLMIDVRQELLMEENFANIGELKAHPSLRNIETIAIEDLEELAKRHACKLYANWSDKKGCMDVVFANAETQLPSIDFDVMRREGNNLASFPRKKMREGLIAKQIKEALKTSLPAYMIPTHFFALDEFPLSANGKIDKKKLLALSNESSRQKGGEQPQTHAEKQLAALWEDVLKEKRISLDDNFFNLGGHSIKAIQLSNAVQKAFGLTFDVNMIFQYPDLKAQAALLESLSDTGFSSIPQIPRHDFYDLSNGQRRFWVLQQFQDAQGSYNMPCALRLKGSLNFSTLEKALLMLVQRHEILRTNFAEVNGKTVQFVREITQAPLYQEKVENEFLCQKAVWSEIAKAFDLENSQLFYLKVYMLSDEDCILLFNMHHIISDGWSINVMLKEFTALYEEFCTSSSSTLPLSSIQYKDYAAWQNTRLSSGELETQMLYWHNKLNNTPNLELPTDFERPTVKSRKGEHLLFSLDQQTSAALKVLCQQEGTTLFAALIALTKTLLYRYSGQTDIATGTISSGRKHPDLENQIGFYVNTVVLRDELKPDESFKENLRLVKTNVLEAFKNDEYPFDFLVEELDLQRDTGRNPLFDVLIVLQNNESGGWKFHQATAEGYMLETNTSNFDLTFNFYEREGEICLGLEYRMDLFKKETIERLFGHLQELTVSAIAKPGDNLNSLDIIPKAEKQELLHAFNDPAVNFAENKNILDSFEEQVHANPEQTALIFEDKEISYAQLDAQANQLANMLMDNHNVVPGDLVGILLERSEWQVISIFAILKTGAAYVPIDYKNPTDRLLFFVEDSELVCLIAQKDLELPKPVINLKQANLNLYPTHIENKPTIGACSLAYVIYTSGSTGLPKGVLVEHRAVLNLVAGLRTNYGVDKDETHFMVSPHYWDCSVTSIFLCLLTGNRLLLVSEDKLLNMAHLTSLMEKHNVSQVDGCVSFMEQLELPAKHTMKRIMAGGEPCTTTIVEKFAAECDYWNAYGPTEACVITSMKKLQADTPITIGQPIANTEILILDAGLNLCPIGVPGEICISGAGLARGYLNRPEITAEKFIPHPFKKGEKLYRSGDMGRCLSNNEIDFIGRKDSQVKIRGVRIELGGIQACLEKHTDVKACSVLAKKMHGENELAAFVVWKKPQTTKAAVLRDYLSEQLPEYMIPTYFTSLENLPLTGSGKLDTKALLSVKLEQTREEGEYDELKGHTELLYSEIWKSVLGITKIGATDNFFHQGGHSMKAIELVNRIQQELSVELPIDWVFKAPTIREQASLIQKGQLKRLGPIQLAGEQDDYPLSRSQKSWYDFEKNNRETEYLPALFPLFFSDKLNVAALENALKQLVFRHEILRTYFVEKKGEPRQKIRGIESFEMLHEKQAGRTVAQILDENNELFALDAGQLCRFKLISLDNNGEHVLLFKAHHLVYDGTSMGIYLSEINRLYQGETLPKPKLQYKDYAYWEQSGEQIKKQQENLQYWIKQFQHLPEPLRLPFDFQPKNKDYGAFMVKKVLEQEYVDRLAGLAAAEGTSLHNIFVAVQTLLLHSYNGQTDIVNYSLASTRNHPDCEKLGGIFIDQIPLRVRFTAEITFVELLREVKRTFNEAFRHRDCPAMEYLAGICPSNRLKGNGLGNPFNGVGMNYYNNKKADLFIEGVSLPERDNHLKDNVNLRSALVVGIENCADSIQASFGFLKSMFKQETAKDFAGKFIEICEKISINSSLQLNEFVTQKWE